MSEHFFIGDALPPKIKFAVWKLLSEAAERRSLTRDEIHLRCVVRPRPWSELKIHPTTYYRRKKRALRRAREDSGAPSGAGDERIGRDGKSYSIRQAPS